MIEKSYGEPSISEYKCVALGCVIEKLSVLGKFINKNKVNGKIIKNGKKIKGCVPVGVKMAANIIGNMEVHVYDAYVGDI